MAFSDSDKALWKRHGVDPSDRDWRSKVPAHVVPVLELTLEEKEPDDVDRLMELIGIDSDKLPKPGPDVAGVPMNYLPTPSGNYVPVSPGEDLGQLAIKLGGEVGLHSCVIGEIPANELVPILYDLKEMKRKGYELSDLTATALARFLYEEKQNPGKARGENEEREMYKTMMMKWDDYKAGRPPSKTTSVDMLPQEEVNRKLGEMERTARPAKAESAEPADIVEDTGFSTTDMNLLETDAGVVPVTPAHGTRRRAGGTDDVVIVLPDDYREQVNEGFAYLGVNPGHHAVIGEMLEDDPRKLTDILHNLRRFSDSIRERDRPSPDAIVRMAECRFYNKPVSQLASEYPGEFGQDFYDEIARGISRYNAWDAVPDFARQPGKGNIATLVDMASPLWRVPAGWVSNSYRRIRNWNQRRKDRKTAQTEQERREYEDAFRQARERGGEDALSRAISAYNAEQERMSRRRALKSLGYTLLGLAAAGAAGYLIRGSGKKVEGTTSAAPMTAPAPEPAPTPAPTDASIDRSVADFTPEEMHEWHYEGRVYKFPKRTITRDQLYDRAQDLMQKYDADTLLRKLDKAAEGKGLISQKGLDSLR